MKRKYISNMPIEGFSKYHICRNGRLYWGTPRDNTQQCIKDGRFPFRKKKKVDENKLIHQYNIGIPRKDILEEFRISTKLLYSILRKHNVKLRKS